MMTISYPTSHAGHKEIRQTKSMKELLIDARREDDLGRQAKFILSLVTNAQIAAAALSQKTPANFQDNLAMTLKNLGIKLVYYK